MCTLSTYPPRPPGHLCIILIILVHYSTPGQTVTLHRNGKRNTMAALGYIDTWKDKLAPTLYLCCALEVRKIQWEGEPE